MLAGWDGSAVRWVRQELARQPRAASTSALAATNDRVDVEVSLEELRLARPDALHMLSNAEWSNWCREHVSPKMAAVA